MRVVSVSENKDLEKRIAITPEMAKKYLSLGIDLSISENYGNHLGFSDNDYKDLGVKVINNDKEILESGDIIVQLGLPSDDKLSYLKENQNLVGILNPYYNKEKLNNLIKKNK